jgi:protein TonB
MILKLRPLGISLLFHIIAFGLFLFWLTGDRPKQIPKPLKIHISSFVTPAVQRPSPTIVIPSPVVPKKQIITPVQKPTPLPSVVVKPLLSKTTPVTTVARPTPQIVPISPVQAPAATVVETSKAPVAVPPSPPVNVEKDFLNAHLGEIRGLLLQNLKYPKMAQKLKMQGDVRVAFTLDADGSVGNIKVIESSGFEILDEDAVALIEKTASKFPKPSKSVRISVPLSYVLH